MIEIILFSYLPALLGMLIIALSVLARQRRPAYVAFALLLFCVIAWLTPQAISLIAPEDTALWLVRLSFLTCNFIGPLFLLFAFLYPNAISWLSLRNTLLIVAPACSLAAVSFLPSLVDSVERRGNDLILYTGSLYEVQTVYIVGSILASLGVLVWKYYHVASKEKAAIFMLLIAFLPPLVTGVLTNYVWINNPGAQYFVPITLLLTALIIVYAMARHKLFDIRLAAVRGAAYTLALLTLAGVYMLAAFVISKLFLPQAQESFNPISIALALMLAFLFQPVKRFFDHLTNKIFFHDNYNMDDFLARLGQELSTASDLKSLLLRAASEISETIQAEQGFFFVRNEEGRHINVGTPKHGHLTREEGEMLDKLVERSGQKIIVADLLPETEREYRMLERRGIALVLPLIHNGKMFNYLLIGRRRSREYSQRDVKALETIADELVIAIQNALSVEEVRNINATLHQRIEDATKELRASNAQLQRLDEAKDEFISMASHQLRTPLTSVKGYLSMVLEGDVGKITPTQQKLLSEAFTSSERMVHLINDFLNVSRLQTGKFMLERRAIDLSKVVAQEVESLQTTAESRNLTLSYRKPARFPILYIDEGKLRQVLMNFIDNAIYYSHEHTTIRIELEIVEGDAVLKVHDTGIGVPKSEQAHLFTKFFRATNARKQRPDGTGVGLFLTKKVIAAHGGSVLFESSEDEGSTFGFRLPIKKLSSAPKDDADKLNN